MSADNWTQCPQCSKAQRDAIEERNRQLQKAYGKVSADEYLTLATAPLPAVSTGRTNVFREDYEIGVRGDTLEIGYAGECQTCGFTVTFRLSKSVFEVD